MNFSRNKIYVKSHFIDLVTNLVPQNNGIVFQVTHLNNRIEKKKQRKS